jgi:hypothetical protein
LAAKTDKRFDYVYMTKIPPRVEKQSKDPCCAALRTALAHDAGYSVVYESTAATIFQRRP